MIDFTKKFETPPSSVRSLAAEGKWIREEAELQALGVHLPELCNVEFESRAPRPTLTNRTRRLLGTERIEAINAHAQLWGQRRQEAIQSRAHALFGLVRVQDRFCKRGLHLCKGLQCECRSSNRKPFNLVPSQFIGHAREMRPENPEPTVSAFASWLYSLYSNDFGDEQDRERGKAIEPAIFKFRKMAQGSVDNSYLRSIGSEWRLIHNGLHMPGHDHVPWFSIGHLRVNGESLRASPDLIYRHPGLNEVLIVEIKHSYMQIPSNLWPNLWGQLWCYSQLDIARNAKRVTVVGEVWNEGRNYCSDPELHLRASERRDPCAPAYDHFFRALFDIYCGRDGIL